MAPIRYSLHYEDYSEHLMSRFGKLLQTQSLVDMTLMCSSHTLRVHKAVLAASSAYFQEVLQKQTGEPLIILKMRFGVLKSLVEFMYCGKTQCLEENLDELVSAAQFLKIKGLSKVTKEGLGITNHSELPVFTPPVVINRPPQSLIDLHLQDNIETKLPPPPPQLAPVTSTSQPMDSSLTRPNKGMVVRIPFDIETGGGASGADYSDGSRSLKPRRGRPSVRRSGGWDGAGILGRAAERALLRREQDSRKAIHQLKHLQSRHMQDYMDRVTLSQAVNSICGPESASSHNYMSAVENELMYMDQSNVLDATMPFGKEHGMDSEIMTSYSNTTPTTSASETASSGIGTAMSQYVNALKNAGLPTDLPILFESGDGSYINVNEQVLLDMVQSSEIQYEVIEQPNIIEKVADPSEIKSIDDLSKSIERGEMLMGSKGYTPTSNYSKETSQFDRHDDALNSLNSILPDNLDSFGDQQSYVVLDPRLQENNNSMDPVNPHDFSCIDGDMQFFTKSMSDDVKKYYEDQQLSDSRVMEQLCPTSSTLDSNFNMSLLVTKNSHLDENVNPLNSEDIRRNEECYDFGLQLPQSTDFKDDTLDCLMATPKHNNDDERNAFGDEKRAQEKEEIIKDLLKIEDKINMERNNRNNGGQGTMSSDINGSVFDEPKITSKDVSHSEELPAVTSSDLHWNNLDLINKDNEENQENVLSRIGTEKAQSGGQYKDEEYQETDDLSSIKNQEHWDDVTNGNDILNKENDPSQANRDETESDDIPYAVGLLPLKQAQAVPEDNSPLKRKSPVDVDFLNNADAKCLKRKVKYKRM